MSTITHTLRLMRSKTAPVLFAVLAFLTVMSVSFLLTTSSEVSAETTMSTIRWKNGSNKILMRFSVPVHNGVNLALETSDFTIGGTDGLTITAIAHSQMSQNVTLTLSGNVNVTGANEVTVACASAAVFGTDSTTCSGPATDLNTVAADATGPVVRSVSKLSATSVFVEFNKLVNNPQIADFTLTTAAAGDNSTITAVEQFNEGVEIRASGATVASGDSVSVATSLQDPLGNAASAATVSIMPTIVISEVSIGTSTNTKDEFVELYNYGSAAVDLSTVRLHWYDQTNTTDTNLTLTRLTTSIQPHAFYLIAPSGFTSGTHIVADARYSTTVVNIGDNGGVYISLSDSADTSVIDKVGWNGSTVKEGTVVASVSAGTSIERKARDFATASQQASAGTFEFSGNATDNDNNVNDFVTQSVRVPQSTQSVLEFSDGFTMNTTGDTTAPTIIGSWPDAASASFIPSQLSVATVDFNEPMAAATINATNIKLVDSTVPGTNLCQTVAYNPANQFGDTTCTVNPSALPLNSARTYQLIVTTGVTDTGSNALATQYLVSFTPQGGTFTFVDSTPPAVVGTFPGDGTRDFPPNGGVIGVNFNHSMDTTTLTASTVTITDLSNNSNVTYTGITARTVVETNDAIDINLTGNLTAGRQYRVTMSTGVKSADGIAFTANVSFAFTASSTTDVTGPIVTGTVPTNSATSVSVNTPFILVNFDENVLQSSIANAVSVNFGSDILTSTNTYNSSVRQLQISLVGSALEPSSVYTVKIKGGTDDNALKNTANLKLQDTDGTSNNVYQFTFTTGAADTVAPEPLYSTMTGNNAVIRFSEPMMGADITNLANWTLKQDPSGANTTIPLNQFSGQSVTWDPVNMEATLTGFNMPPGAVFSLTPISTMRDLSGNTIGVATALMGTVENAATCPFCGGMDTGFGDQKIFDNAPGFSDASFGYVPQASAWPMNQVAGLSTGYEIDFPVTKQIPTAANSGKIVLTFPTGFDVTNAALNANSFVNNDINEQSPGTIGITALTKNAVARTVSLTLNTATRCNSGNTQSCGGATDDFLHFDIKGIVNSTVPRGYGTQGYTVDMKTFSGTTLLDNYTSMPFFINESGSSSLVVDVLATGMTSGTMDIEVFCPSIGMMDATLNYATEGDGTARTTFSGLRDGDYCDVRTRDRMVSLGGLTDNFLGIEYEPVVISGATTKTVTMQGTSAMTSVTVQLTGAGSKNVDVFAMPENAFGFFMPVMKSITTTTGTDTVVLKLQNGNYRIGVGPAMPKTGGFSFPPQQDYTITPNDIRLNVNGATVTETSGTANDGTVTFNLGTLGNTVTFKVQDSSAKVIADAVVYVDSTDGMFHTFAQTGTTGTATAAVPSGVFRVGAFLPGAPPTGELKMRVDGSGNVYKNGSTSTVTQFIIEMSKGSQAISGSVTVDGNAVSGAGIFGHCTANCAGYQDSQTFSSASGTYSLYVGNGTWTVNAFIPGYGQVTAQSVIMSGSDQEDINFEPSTTTTFRTITGNICKIAGAAANCDLGTGLGGIEIYAHSAASGGGSNFARTDSDGSYTVRVPAADDYVLEPYDPRTGKLDNITNVDVASANATEKDLAIDTPEAVTINIIDSLSAGVTVDKMIVEFVENTKGVTQNVMIRSEDDGTINLPEGTYEVFVRAPGMDVTETTAVTGAGVSSGILTVDGSETVSITLPSLKTISGTLKDENNNALEGAVVEFSDTSTGTTKTVVTNSSGVYSASVPDGTYQVVGYSPGVVVESNLQTVSGANVTLNMTGNVTDQTIGGTITDTSGSPVAYAFVTAEQQGGGSVTVQANASGVYSLPVDDGTWAVSAVGHGFAAKALTTDVDISGASATSKDIQFTAAVATVEPTVQSLTPSKGGVVDDTDAVVKVQVPGNALSTSANAGTLTIKETNNAVSTSTATIIDNAFEVSASDAGGTLLTTDFDSDVTITHSLTKAELVAAGADTSSEVDDLTISYFSSSGAWVDEPTSVKYLNSSGATVTPTATLSNVSTVEFATKTDHFTVFSITASADGVSPAAPTGVAANGGKNQVIVTWSAVTTNSDASAITDLLGYEIYRDTSATGSFTTQLNSSNITGTSYTDTTAAVGTTYYYKVTAADTGGQESAKSSAASAQATSGSSAVTSGGGGGGGVVVQATSISVKAVGTEGVVTGGTNVKIGWTIGGDARTVDVYVSYDDGKNFTLVDSGQASNSDYIWAVPNVAADKVKVRVDVRNGGEVLNSSTSTVFKVAADQAKTVVPVKDVSTPDPVTTLFPSKTDAKAQLPVDLNVGDLVKSPGMSAVYMLGGDGKRHSFPNELVYFSWFNDFNSIKEISVSKMASMTLGKPVRARPGTWMIKIQSDARTYAVEPGGVIRWVQTETVAKELFGDQWNKRIIDVEPTMFANYTAGAAIANGHTHPAGMVVRDASGKASYVAEDGKRRSFADEVAVRANMMQTRFERPATEGDLAKAVGVAIKAVEDVIFGYQDTGR